MSALLLAPEDKAPALQQDANCAFRVRLHSVVVSDFKQRHRAFGERLRCAFRFQQGQPRNAKKALGKVKQKINASGKGKWERVLKTEYKESHGGDCLWALNSGFKLHTPYASVANVSDWLRDHYVTVQVYSKADSKDNKKFGGGSGEVKVDLFTCATGPARHNLPLTNKADEEVGRIEFVLEMQQETSVETRLSELRARNLMTTEKSKSETDINAYLKYGYSLNWPSGHVYSRCRERSANPSWVMADLPMLSFRTTLDELLSQSLFIHVTDAHDDALRGEKHTPLGEMKFVFRSAIEAKGDDPIDTGGIKFRSPLTLNGRQLKSSLEGILTFDNIPRFAQMKAVNAKRVAVHTERGILDAVSLFPWVVMPDVECFLTDKAKKLTNEAEDLSPAPFSRAVTPVVNVPEGTANASSNNTLTRSRSRSHGGEEPIPDLASQRPTAAGKRLTELTGSGVNDNLISFSPAGSPATGRKGYSNRTNQLAPPAGVGAPTNLFGSSADPFLSTGSKPPVAPAASTATAADEFDPLKKSQAYNPFA